MHDSLDDSYARYFGPKKDIFGWVHVPKGARRDVGVLLVGAFGYETLCTYRAFRELALSLAQAGFVTLRLDPHGTGQSGGSDEDADRVPSWLASIDAGFEALLEQPGVERLAVVGVRLGATLCAKAASRRSDVVSAALLAPFPSGRAYVRELKALSMMATPMGEAPPSANGDLEAAGFVLTEETQAALGDIDLFKLEARPAEHVLVLQRDDAPLDARWQGKLEATGARVEVGALKGYVDVMRDLHFSPAPKEAFAQVEAFFSTQAKPSAGTGLSFKDASATLDGAGYRETRMVFGKESPLVGILCSPTSTLRRRITPIFLNTGANPMMGSNRMAVTYARALAQSGFSSLRFDLKGLGDSPSRDGKGPRLYSKDACVDVVAAMDALEERGHRRFVLVGLCSGAYLAFHTALLDARVAGLALLNAQRFTWTEGDSLEVAMRKSFKSTRFYTDQIFNPEVWKRLAKGEVNVVGIARTLGERVLRGARTRLTELPARVLGASYDTNEVVQGFAKLASRGAHTLLTYSAMDGGLDELDAQLGHGMRKLHKHPSVRLEILEGADHTLTAAWARARYLELLRTHLEAL